MRIVFALPGLHRANRGAEVVFEAIAQEVALSGKDEVTVIGSGAEIPGRAYQYMKVPAISRDWFERWPKLPLIRNEFMYEEMTFAAGLMMANWRKCADITMTCGYPYTNWALRSRFFGLRRPPHVFVTENGDWPAYETRHEYRFFSCDGLICTNPIYYERNRNRWFSTLIPNGIDTTRFHIGPGRRREFGIPENQPVILMVSALSETKRVLEGLHAIARIPNAFCVIAGDGPLRTAVDELANRLLPRRFIRRTFPRDAMPALYRCADAFLHMAVRESFGNVYIEALSTGTPVVAHDDEVTRWIFQGHAHLVDTASVNAVVEALTEALQTSARDGAEIAAFTSARYAWPRIAAQYRDFFEEVIRRTVSQARS